ncbi:hypothetical protein TNCT_200741 [Trichonephila clavata]|uniref:C2H2-type domain-containing protein n=1 Tax=Trichonephila clavata TaxID=2740835 RepID=A0A8X6HT40_TRICU|nr:hypothetical protein TNCT_200741 [Trichonephila clavata]
MDAEVISKDIYCRACYSQLRHLFVSHVDSFWYYQTVLTSAYSRCGRRVYCGMDVEQHSMTSQVEIFRCGGCQLVFMSKESLTMHAGPPNHF